VRILAAGVCLFQCASTAGAQEPELVKLSVSEGNDIFFSHLTWKDGLSPGSIGQILQDDRGFLWIRSAVLDRYDGNEFKSYRRDAAHPNNPAGSALHHVVIDPAGALWVTSNESLDRFDLTTETSTRFAIDRDGLHSVRQPQHVLQDRAGILWLATATGLHRLDPATGEFRHYAHDPADPDSLASSQVTSTYEDPHGTLWVLTLAGLDAFDRRTEKVTERIRFSLPDGRALNNALEDRSGVLWITYVSGNGLASWDRRTRRLTRYSFKDREPPASQLSGVAGIHEDADRYLWLATYGSGLVRIDPNRRSAVQYRHSPLQANGISDNQLGAVFEDREGNIWVGTGTGRLNRFRRKPLPFTRYPYEAGNPESLLIPAISSVYADSQDNIWVGHVSGLTRIDGKSGKYSWFSTAGSAPRNLSNTFVTSIVEDHSGYLWFGTYGGGLNRYDPRTGRFVAFRHHPGDPHSLSHDIVYSLMVDRNGTLWVGTADGLNRCDDPVTGRFRPWKVDRASGSPQEVPAIIEGPDGVVWLVSQTLQRFDPATERFTAYRFDLSGPGRVDRLSSTTLVALATKTVNSFLAIDQSGVLWAGTPNGLLRFDRDREQFEIYGEREGLSGSSVLGILEDRHGNLWVGTDGGLSQFNPATKTFTNYYENDGLASHAFEGFPAAFRSRRGQMFFGSTSGLTSFWPDQIVESRTVPPVVFTEFLLRNVPVSPAARSVLAQSITYTPSLTLSHDQNMFSFEFAALSYVDPQRNQYRYMLEPLDRSWHRVDAQRRIATFTTLPAGQYTLRVQGSNNRGVWNEDGLTLSLEVLPPWWGTTWFRTACVGMLLALLWAGYQLRLRQLHHQFDMTLEARVGERTRIARELHDTLLQGFHGLLLRFQTASYLLPERPADAKRELDGAIEYAAKAITEGRDAVQGLRSSTVEGNDLAAAIRTLGDELATGATGHSTPAFRVGVEGHPRDLRPIVRDEIYKIAGEALRNSFRHADARQIEAELRYDDKEFRLRVRDDGKGIDQKVLAAQGIEGHYGLRGMSERAALIGGTVSVWSEVGAGTEVELRISNSAVFAAARRRSWWSRLFRSSMRAERKEMRLDWRNRADSDSRGR
jgi:signal transduction histidine kinase/ligand-binding sensor domain-containing protein